MGYGATKYCPQCKQTKMISEFYFDICRGSPGKGAYCSACKVCMRAKDKARKQKRKYGNASSQYASPNH